MEKVIHKVNFSKDDPRTITSYEVYFSLYQQLAGKNEEQDENAENALDKLSQLFSPDFFDLIIVDECHRGSAKKESKLAQNSGILFFCHANRHDCYAKRNQICF